MVWMGRLAPVPLVTVVETVMNRSSRESVKVALAVTP